MYSKERQKAGLRAGFTPLGMWAFSIGTSIGWGSFIVTCNTYLQKSGILGTIFGLLVGMAVIFVITWNLQYMIRNSPGAGGIYTIEKRIGQKDLGFLAFWFVLLTYLAILWANITSLPLFARFFLGDTFHFGFHYQIFGYEVWLGEALLSMCAVALIGLLCAKSALLPKYIMIAAALVFAAGFTVCTFFAIFRYDSSFSYSPLYLEGSNPFAQIVRIAAISPWAFIGFENISHFSEEYAFPMKKVRGILISSVLITTLLYLFVSLLSVSAYPPEYESWLAYIQDMGNLEGIKAVPAFYAADHYLGQTGVTVLMCSLFGVILTSLIGNMLALSRLLFAAGREGDAPAALGKLNKHSVPGKAILVIVLISLLIPFLGRTAIGWIVDVTTLGATIIYGLISHAAFQFARNTKKRLEQYTGIIGLILMVCFVLLLLIPGLLPFHAMETESYILFIIWAVLGLLVFRRLIRKDKTHEYGQSFVVWILLLVLVLFASMMWVSRATENAAEQAVERIYEYHESHPSDDSGEDVRENRVKFLHEQARQISSTNTLYTVVSLGLFLLAIIMMMNNYRDTQKLGKQLTAAENEASAAKKIAELRKSITSLLDNMPALSFSKDAQTGVYIACNQAFAEYAHKESPEGVVGLTDAQIFDPVTATHFVEDDKMALSMDAPYIFYEDVPDAVGNQRQFQTTKLKFFDETGRLCLLGMCADITDMVRIRRENTMTKEAYEKVRTTGIIYTHIAQTLARGYNDLLYVNLDTEEYIVYRSDLENGGLNEIKRDQHFFEKCRSFAEKTVYADDKDLFIQAMERQTLLETLEKTNTFIMTFRVLINEGPFYVSMRISRMEDDDRVIIIGISDVDEQMKQRQAAELMKEERIAYARLNALAGDILCLYVINPETGHYREYSVTEAFSAYELPREGENFLKTVRDMSKQNVYEEDRARFFSLFTMENILAGIRQNGIFSLLFRMLFDGKLRWVRLQAAMVEEEDGLQLIIGMNDADFQVRQEEEYGKRLALAQTKASIDALTGVKNKHAYLDAEEQLDRLIEEQRAPEFAIVILDVNDLKIVNDTDGHQAGDQYLKGACKIICNTFKHSPVFRVGGDEFAVIAQGDDYARIDELIGKVGEHNRNASQNGGIVIACGMAKYENDTYVATVFERADINMYENKNILKTQS